MSDLRKQLRGLQSDYKSQKYPGDLAADVLGSASARSVAAGGGWMKIAVGMAAAVALAGLVWVGLDRRPDGVEVAVIHPPVHPPVQTPAQSPDALASQTNEVTPDGSSEVSSEAVRTLIAAKPAEAEVERPAWSTVHEDDNARPSFGSIGGMSLQYQSISLPTFSEIQTIRDEQDKAVEQTQQG